MGSGAPTTGYSSSRGRTARRVEQNGAQCFRGNILPRRPSDGGFEDSLRDYLTKHEPGLSITAETSRCQWRGESMDYSQAIEAMQVLERKAAVLPAHCPKL